MGCQKVFSWSFCHWFHDAVKGQLNTPVRKLLWSSVHIRGYGSPICKAHQTENPTSGEAGRKEKLLWVQEVALFLAALNPCPGTWKGM